MNLAYKAEIDSKGCDLVPLSSSANIWNNTRSCLALIVLATLMFTVACSKAESEVASTTSAAQIVSTSDRKVTPQELGLFLDWQAETNNLLRRAYSEAMANQNDSMEEKIARAKRNAELGAPLLAREPFKTGTKGSAMRDVISAFYISGSFYRDEKQLTVLRGRYGAEMIDSIANQEALFHQKLDQP